ncbi:hypothetical protein LAZ67_5001915 [Cordylochernes scorpioides]|uniref:Uncharacterized protein n=1 Tax=Cordylochernes scorpioides TaxID=51811 RepID=A0ABY6KIW6_9ARAC|nr:hypothetical protein LAZ67_5001915 [Cordylochernes scorpioides]
MKLLLKKIEYERYSWKICSDLKVIALLRGLQLGYTKFCCFLCEWDSRDRERHYIKKSWPNREIFTPGHKNIVNPPLIDSENIYLPPLHIKLGSMKNFVKAMDRNASGFAYLKQKCSSISDAKIKEGIFVGPQIREFLQDEYFQNSLNEVEAAAWNSFRNVCKNFLGSVQVENYRDIKKIFWRSLNTYFLIRRIWRLETITSSCLYANEVEVGFRDLFSSHITKNRYRPETRLNISDRNLAQKRHKNRLFDGPKNEHEICYRDIIHGHYDQNRNLAQRLNQGRYRHQRPLHPLSITQPERE